MKNFIYILLFFSNFIFGQLSNKHWIPPLHSRSSSVVNDQYIYLSTPSAVPFQVNIKTGDGTPIQGSPFTISQGNPQIVGLLSGQPSEIFAIENEINTPISQRGLILEGSREFYVSFRVRSQNHAEILVSKGKTALGTDFRVGSLPQNTNGNLRNFVSSFMATEDNTIVTVNEYNTEVVFAGNNSNSLLDELTFQLNAGESVVVSGYTDTPANLTGFVGAKITSNNPIVVNTGNALGGMLTEQDGQDFNLDQIVPYDQIGTEYILIRGNGSDSTENPLVIATENNTEIFVNGITTPLAVLNAGEYYLVPNSNYQGVNNKNMYITSSKPIYMYQIIAGSGSDATSGMNFIPPLSCFFQKKVDLIPEINKIGNTTYQGEVIALTYTNSILSINGTPTMISPEPVLGNTIWTTYRIPGLSGNVVIESTGPLAVGAFGASSAAGYAGYYSGFGTEPRDTTVSICSNSDVNLLELIDGNPEPGGTWNPLLASGTNIFNPNIDPSGVYNYVYNGTCTIIDVEIDVTVVQAPFAGNNTPLTVCSTDSPIDLFPLLGTNVTTGGTWVPALASGTSIYNPAVDLNPTYSYKIITQNNVCNEITADVSITRNLVPNVSSISDYVLCDDNLDGDNTNGLVTFNLSSKNSEIINGQNDVVVTYFSSQNNAENNTNQITSIYSGNATIYVRLTNSLTNCFSITSFNLVVNSLPTINSNIVLKQCDTDLDAITSFNLTEANTIFSNQSDLTFTYFENQTDAANNTNEIVNTINYNAANNTTVWVRITNSNNCYKISSVLLLVSATQIPQTFSLSPIEKCDYELSVNDPANDGIDYFDLTPAASQLIALFPNQQNLTVAYYENESDALQEINPITNITNYRNTNSPNEQLIWARIDSSIDNSCVGLGPFVKLIVNPIPIFDLGDNFVLCVDSVTGTGFQQINATPSNSDSYSYYWTPTNTVLNPNGGQSAIYNVVIPGTYSVLVKNNSTGCESTDTITATFSSPPVSVTATVLTPAFSIGYSEVLVQAFGGYGEYEYSIDGGVEWQTSTLFQTVPNGNLVVMARDKELCGVVYSNRFQTITYPAYFTPNGDGFHDTWNITNLPSSFKAKLSVFDRYGKLIMDINPYYGFGWDGTLNGYPLPATDYWFKLEYTENNERKIFKSHFALKR